MDKLETVIKRIKEKGEYNGITNEYYVIDTELELFVAYKPEGRYGKGYVDLFVESGDGFANESLAEILSGEHPLSDTIIDTYLKPLGLLEGIDEKNN